MRALIIAFAVVLGLAAATPALAAAGEPSIEVSAAWARATPGGAKTAAAYMTITNKGTADDRLLAVSTSVAKTASLHKTESDNGIMKMAPVKALAVKAGSTLVFKPGSYHVMLMGLSAPLKAGETFPMTLVFEKAGKIEATFKVEKAGAMGPDSMGGMKMD